MGRRRTLNLSRIFTAYVKRVAKGPLSFVKNPAHSPLPHSNEDGASSTASIQPSADSPTLINDVSLLSVDPKGLPLEVSALQELEAIKMTATEQPSVFGVDTLKHLGRRGFSLMDFAAWNWILFSKNATDAALRLELVRRQVEATADLGPVPLFVLQKLLLRNDISAQALSILIRQIWQHLNRNDQQSGHNNGTAQNDVQNTTQTIRSIGLDELIILVVRLLRHARVVWPSAVTNIAELWVRHARNDGTKLSRLSFHYNRILQLIALPSSESPYQSLHHRQRAFFVLYHRMIDPKARLTISREGYRAFIRIQLAHRKTASEREWALLKGPTWPPWKADRTGMDADIGPESGISRATTGLRHAAASGYGPKVWERAARILAGTDGDQSPTIQTRSTMIPLSFASMPQASMPSLPLCHASESGLVRGTSQPDAPAIWIARVKATRTLREALGCFLACRDQGTFMNDRLYEVMIEKILYDDKRRRDTHDTMDLDERDTPAPKQVAMPGDGREVAESSTSHNQAISTREPLPTVSILLKQMRKHGFQPGGRLLALLWTHARSYEEGIEALGMSTVRQSVQSILVHWQEQPRDQIATSDVHALLKTLPDWLLAAYIKFLCKFAEPTTDPESRRMGATRKKHLKQAFRLVRARLPVYRPCWNHLLALLSRHGTFFVGTKQHKRHMEPVVKFDRACKLLDTMDSLNLDMDFTGFSHLCAIVNNAHAEADAEGRSEFVKTRFARMVRPSYYTHGELNNLSDYCRSNSGGDKADRHDQNGFARLPRLFRTPHPAHLHVYIRCLGQHDDSGGLLELMHWLAVFADEVIDEAKELANGRTMFSRCLTALQAFGGQERSQEYQYGLEHLREVLHDRGDQWSAWPSDEEAERYFCSQ
ncbi:MAG: hypothetical protein Q9169_001556 [Polycauliona sp. 2 TL-2023]